MQLIVPFAAPLADAGRATLRTLALPALRAWLAGAAVVERDDGDAWSFSPPHERALARSLGWAAGDGRLPWAAWSAARDGIVPGDLAWGLLTPAHWHLGTDQVSLIDPAGLMLDEAASRALLAAVQPLFTSEGFVVHWGAPQRWYLAHESLSGLRTASLDRVIGRNVDAWLGSDPAARLLRRLQNEVQMLLHEHPLNTGRVARGLLPVNSFWLSGCGSAQPGTTPEPTVDDRLRAGALAEDWAGWAKAWQTLDEGPIAALRGAGEAARLTLAGERSAVTLRPAGGWRRWRAFVHRPAPLPLLEGL